MKKYIKNILMKITEYGTKYLNTYRLAVYLMTLFTSTNHKPALPFVFFKNFNSLESLSQLKYFQNIE